MVTFLVLLAAGAAAIAVWIDARFDHLGPRDFRGALIHCGIALGGGWFLVPLGIEAAIGAGLDPLVVVFALALPALVYLFLAAFWLLKQTQGLLLRR